ncbi:MAG: HIT domain-containing protein [Alphaproteobacteria bacterium]|nr:HIT domain-containing protein [Alphaproteobacteria bacterium]
MPDFKTVFKLDPKLEKDSFLSDIFDEIQIRIINDSRYIWFILVPAIPQLKEWHDLHPALEAKLLHITRNLSQFLSQTLHTDKINIAALGNIVSQFHLHIIARHKGDASWPNPVWGDGIATALEKDELHARQKLISDFHKYLFNVNAQG